MIKPNKTQRREEQHEENQNEKIQEQSKQRHKLKNKPSVRVCVEHLPLADLDNTQSDT